jgi:agmatine/peptidylarginine deiminase
MVNASSLTYQIALSVDNDTTAERQIIYKDNAGLALVAQTQDGGVSQATLTMGNVTANTAFKAAHAYTLNDMAAVLNGGTVQTDGTGTMPTLTSMKFGQNADNTLQLNGYFRQVTYLKRRATNGELQTRTT